MKYSSVRPSLRHLVFISLLLCTSFAYLLEAKQAVHHKKIYHKGWIDFNKNGKKDIYEDPNQDIDKRIDDLLSQMTLEEKTCQLATLYGFGQGLKDELPTPEWKHEIWKDGIANIDEHLTNRAYSKRLITKLAWPPSTHLKSLNEVQRFFVEETRLGIPAEFTTEGIRGLCSEKASCFPAQLGVGSTWDADLVHQIGVIEGQEAKLLGYANVYSPILDMARDPRWGRTVECYSEDPFLVSELGVNMTKGLQSQGVVSTPKHFGAYCIPNGGRDGDARTDPEATEQTLHSILLYPFERVMREGKALGVMCSYNDYDGTPIAGSHYFLTELLRNQWGFKGYVVSDSHAVEDLKNKHRVVSSLEEAVALSINSGLNVRTDFAPPSTFILPLRQAIKDSLLSMSVVDQRVRDVLRVKFWEGLFDKPYGDRFQLADETVGNAAHQKVAKQASLESIVLLKNENNILPLDLSKYKSILVTGPNAAATAYAISRYGPSHVKVESVLEGIKSAFPATTTINYSEGCDFFDKNWPENELLPMAPEADDQQRMDEAVNKAKDHDLIIAVMGDCEKTVGESRSRTSLNLPGNQDLFLRSLYATGKPVILILLNGRPVTINWADKYLPAIIEGWFPGQYGGSAIADVLLGTYNPGGKLSISFPRTVGEIPMHFPYKPHAQAGQPHEGPNGVGNTRITGFLYPFGYGLSYTTFQYSNLHVSNTQITLDSSFQVSVDVQNTGSRKGDEVVQLYFKDLVSSVTTYEKQLRGFRRVSLEPKETKTVTFNLSTKDLALYGRANKWVCEPGDFELMIGASSEDIKLKQLITVK